MGKVTRRCSIGHINSSARHTTVFVRADTQARKHARTHPSMQENANPPKQSCKHGIKQSNTQARTHAGDQSRDHAITHGRKHARGFCIITVALLVFGLCICSTSSVIHNCVLLWPICCAMIYFSRSNAASPHLCMSRHVLVQVIMCTHVFSVFVWCQIVRLCSLQPLF